MEGGILLSKKQIWEIRRGTTHSNGRPGCTLASGCYKRYTTVASGGAHFGDLRGALESQ